MNKTNLILLAFDLSCCLSWTWFVVVAGSHLVSILFHSHLMFHFVSVLLLWTDAVMMVSHYADIIMSVLFDCCHQSAGCGLVFN